MWGASTIGIVEAFVWPKTQYWWKRMLIVRIRGYLVVKWHTGWILGMFSELQVGGSYGGMTPLILNLGTSSMWVVSFTRRPIYPWGNIRRYAWSRRLCGPAVGLVAWEKKEICCLYWAIEPRFIGRSVRSHISTRTDFSWLFRSVFNMNITKRKAVP
jgi:hypothetical protein